MNSRRFLAASAAALLLSPLAASAAIAAPPDNDLVTGATPITLSQTVTQDTTEATTDGLDAELNQNCGAPATNGSVWFSYEDTSGAGLLVDLSSSDFSTGAMIVAGDPTAGGYLVACGPGAVATRGDGTPTTYYVMAFSDTPGVTGGQLSASFQELPPAPSADLTVDAWATAYRDGSMRLTGTYTCANADYDAFIDGTVTQTVGRTKIQGGFFVYPLECDGQTHQWEAIATSYNGLFAGGKAASVSFAIACGLADCAFTMTEQKIQVRRGR
jgi:hypothetical protein